MDKRFILACLWSAIFEAFTCSVIADDAAIKVMRFKLTVQLITITI